MRIVFVILITLALVLPVFAMDFTAPAAPEAAQPYMPDATESFGDGLWFVIRKAIALLRPELAEAGKTCLCIVAAVLVCTMMDHFSKTMQCVSGLVGAVSIGMIVLRKANTLIRLGSETVTEISTYGKLLLPVMSAALAAQGGVSTATALYTGTVMFLSILTNIISKVVVPIIYAYLAVSIAACALPNTALQELNGLAKWSGTWLLKIVLYIFTGYISVTGVVSGSVDSISLKAAKLAISGAVPVVGSILSDASETVLVSAGFMKHTAGIYGLLAVIAICVGPFLKIGAQYLLLKLTTAVCGVFTQKSIETLLKNLSGAMAMILAMTGSTCLMLLVGLVCFMRGVA